MDRPSIRSGRSTGIDAINSINGPVSLIILTNGDKTFYLLGDEHDSKDRGCAGGCVALNERASNLIHTEKKCMDINAALHTWLLYNNQEGIETDVFYEAPFIHKSKHVRKRGVTQDLDRFGNKMWLQTLTYLFGPCKTDKKACVYSPSVRLHRNDIRQHLSDSGSVFADPFTYLAIRIPDDLDNIIEWSNTLNIIRKHVGVIINAITKPSGFSEIRQVINELRANKNITGQYGVAVLQTIEEMAKNITTKRAIVAGETPRILHRVAAQILKLKSKDPKAVEALYNYINNTSTSLAEQLASQKDLQYLAVLKFLRDEGQEYEALMIFNEFSSNLSLFCLFIGALFMDVYTIARALYYNSKEIILYTGNIHNTNYLEILGTELRYKNLLTLGSIGSGESTARFLVEEIGDIGTMSRCISSPKLEQYVGLGKKLQSITESGTLKNAEYILDDYAIS